MERPRSKFGTPAIGSELLTACSIGQTVYLTKYNAFPSVGDTLDLNTNGAVGPGSKFIVASDLKSSSDIMNIELRTNVILCDL